MFKNVSDVSDVDCKIDNLGSVEGWKKLSIKECGEPLVPLGPFGCPEVATAAIYVGERSSPYPCGQLSGALFTTFVREGVARRLVRAAEMMQPGMMFLVWDGYRPLAVQRALYDYYVRVLESTGMTHDQAAIDAQRFVSIPSTDPTKPPPHNTGGAVDLTIIRFDETAWCEMRLLTEIVKTPETEDNWRQIYGAEMRRQQLIREASRPLEMGTVFDEVSPATATRFYEEQNPSELDEMGRQCLANRRLLWNVMTMVGFSNYSEEWWHYDFGNQFDMARTGRPAIYGAAALSKNNEEWEATRRGHYHGSVIASQLGRVHHSPTSLVSAADLLQFVSDVAVRTGDLRDTVHPRAAAL